MPQNLELLNPTATHQTFTIPDMGGQACDVALWYNLSDDYWYMALFSEGHPVMGMRRLTTRAWVLPSRTQFGGGDLWVAGPTDPKGRTAWADNNTLWFWTGEEIAGLDP